MLSEVNHTDTVCTAERADAIILVHGVSPHQPMEALEALLKEYAKARYPGDPEGLSQEERYTDIGATVRQIAPYYRVTGPRHDDAVVDFFEALWSADGKNHISGIRLALWLIGASLRPSRFLAMDSPISKRRTDALAFLLIGIAIAGLIVIAGYVAALTVFAANLCWQRPFLLGTIGAVITLVLVFWNLWANKSTLATTSVNESKDLARYVTSIVSICSIITVCCYLIVRDLNTYSMPETFSLVALALIISIAFWKIPKFLRWLEDHVADIYIATRTDINDPIFSIREKITKRVSDMIDTALTTKCACPGCHSRYCKIIVLGHSLGSVIALDAFRQLRERYAALEKEIDFKENEKPSDRELAPPLRVTALVTYGSPLQKIGVFRGQHKPSKTDFEDYLRKRNADLFRAEPERIRWVNYWSANDHISDPLGNTKWLANADAIVDIEMPRAKKPHGAYILQSYFWRNARRTGILDLLSSVSNM